MTNNNSFVGSPSRRTTILLCLQLLGYPLAPCASQLVGIPNVALSYPIRFAVFFLSLVQLPIAMRFWRGAPQFLRWGLSCYAIFWVVFYWRVLDDLFVKQIATNANVSVYVFFPFLVTAVPILALFQPLADHQTKYFREFFLYAGAFCTSLYLINILKLSASQKAQKLLEGRFGLDFLNPIQSGYVGAAACLGAISFLIYEATTPKPNRAKLAVGVVSALLGVIMVLMAASRAPLVAFFLGVFVLLFAEAKVAESNVKRKKLTLRVGISITVFVVLVFLGAQLVFGLNPFGRFETAFGDDPYNKNSGTHRLMIGEYALDHFFANPLIGRSAFVNSTEPYPHNLVLEALMAGGILTTIPFLFLLLGALLGFIKLFISGKNPLLVALSFTFFIGSTNSGAISENTEFWGVLAVLIGYAVTLPLPTRRRETPTLLETE